MLHFGTSARRVSGAEPARKVWKFFWVNLPKPDLSVTTDSINAGGSLSLGGGESDHSTDS
jgi:hypothetical protein